jgi:hypothetical protein
MRRLIVITAAFVIAASIVYIATIWRETAAPPPPTDLTRVLAQLDLPTPTGQLEQSRNVPLPETIQPTLAHPFFALVDGHAGVACVDCHVEGMGGEISAECVTCHLNDDPHNGANGSNCAVCHAPTGWQFVSFDHSTIGSQDCADCHQSPVNHFAGACSTCHLDTTSFVNASFDHANLFGQDCVTCHAPPANHYAGICANCHIDTMSFLNVQFDHANLLGQDCVACHAPPANHYAGICANCHIDTMSFLNVQFDHSMIGTQDCVACHQPPPNHFQGSCRTCHQDTINFRNATFNHRFPLNHGDANGVCTTCHINNNPPAYSCTGCHNDQAELVEEHNDEGIFDLSNCVRCHQDGEEPDG